MSGRGVGKDATPAAQELTLALGLALARQDPGYRQAVDELRTLEHSGLGQSPGAESLREGIGARQAQALALAGPAVEVAISLGWRAPRPMPLHPAKGPNER